LLVQSYALDETPYKLSGAVAKLACINLLKFGSFSYWFDKPWFHTEGRLAIVLITPSLGVSNWVVIYSYINTAPPALYFRFQLWLMMICPDVDWLSTIHEWDSVIASSTRGKSAGISQNIRKIPQQLL
jgi:hypothetical protein